MMAFSSVRATPVMVGAAGRAAGVLDELASEAGESPFKFVAFTLKVYAVPLVRPVTSQLVAGAVATQVFPPGLEVTVYFVIGAPPLSAGAVQLTVLLATPASAVTSVGAFGSVDGLAEALEAEAFESPISLVAFTLKV